jgi:transposase-like protein
LGGSDDHAVGTSWDLSEAALHAEIIVQRGCWYITYKLSYRDLAAKMAERAVVVSHTTIPRWTIRYASEFEKRVSN